MPDAKILIVDDDRHLHEALAELLRGRGYDVTTAGSAEEGLERCRETTFHLVLCDLQLPGRNGLSLLKTLHDACPLTATVLMTGHGSIRTAVTALKRGAVEYLSKPLKPKRLLALVNALTADLPPFLPNSLLSGERMMANRWGGFVGRAPSMTATIERLRSAAAGDTPLLVVGESGCGKELAARAVHDHSRRSAKPFGTFSVGALSPESIAADLFGVDRATEKRPGRIESCDGGTLVIDELAALDERTQALLLHFLDSRKLTRMGSRRERTADVRVIALSARDLEPLVRSGQLRQDLYYRLAVVTVALPPLRERVDDVPLLTDELLRDLSAKYGKDVCVVPSETQRLLASYEWPGNVRELRNVVEQAVLLAPGRSLEPSLLPHILHRDTARAEVMKIPIGAAMGNIEKEVILRTLEANRGNKTATAAALGISRRSIYNKLASYGL